MQEKMMNVYKLNKAFNDGGIEKFVSQLSKKEKKELIATLKWDLVNYRKACRNYPQTRYEKLSVPYIKKREGLIKTLAR